MLMFDVSRCMQSLLEVEDYSIRLRPEDLRLIIRLLVDQLIESNLALRCGSSQLQPHRLCYVMPCADVSQQSDSR